MQWVVGDSRVFIQRSPEDTENDRIGPSVWESWMEMAAVNWFISLCFTYNIVLIPSPLPSLVEGLGSRLGHYHSFCCAEWKSYCRGLGGRYTTHSPNSLLSPFAHMLLFLRPVWVGDSEGEEVEWFGWLLDASVDCFLLGANLSTQNLGCKEEEGSTIGTMVPE